MKRATRMEAPLCLVENLEDGKFQVNPQAADILAKISQPVVVVSIVGLYRTGKSYLMNKLAGVQRGFDLGATVEAKTKGIWMWCVPHPTMEKHTLVLLDTEGLGDVQKGDKSNDLKIFCLAILLSSALVYNSKGAIDQDAIEKLRLVSEFADLIKVKSKNNDDEEDKFSRHFPMFIWALRDFTLKLEHNNKEITEDEYLENALKLQKVEDTQENPRRIKERNACRDCIRMYFKTRKCFVFDPPSADKEIIQRMDEVAEEQLRPAFVAQARKFCEYVFCHAEVKLLDQIHPVTGKMLGELVKQYTEVLMNSNDAACIENVVVSISEMENQAAVREATEHYEKLMNERRQFPTETQEEFSILTEQCEEEALQVFMKRSFKDSEFQFHKEYMKNIEQKKNEYFEMNKMESQRYCKRLIGEHCKELDKAVEDGSYCSSGGYQKYQEAMRLIEERYNKEPRKGIQAEVVLQDFIKSQETLRFSIMKSDQTLTEQQKKAEEDKMAEIEKRISELKASQEKKKAEDEKRSAEMNITALLEKTREEKRQLQEKLESVIQSKRREQELYQSQGNDDQARMYMEQMNDLRQEKEQLKDSSWVSSLVSVVSYGAQLVLPGVCSVALGVGKRFLRKWFRI
ncbi:guanylate-binding protein 3-like [Hyperolius riggenbachi]|uniref:guanylate-binding protein 3-like n=1 Tax=Hyperolius riggenbachi TaxID=752182 RepID=UPI0035A3D43C